MSPAATTTPATTKAAILDAVADEKYPKFALGAIASRFNLTYDELRTVIDRAGYPDTDRMRRHAAELRHAGTAPVDEAIAGSPELQQLVDEQQLVMVETNRLRADPDNPRDNLTDIEDLADSIKEVGLLQPVVARRDGTQLVVVAGHRRLAAVRLLRWDRVACIVRDSMRSDAVIAAMLIENGQRVDLDPIEEARGFNRLKVTFKLTDAQVGVKVGRSGPYVSNRLALLLLTPTEQAELRGGNMKLVEAAHRGRVHAGKVMAPGPKNRGWHLSPEHPLAGRAKARCRHLRHTSARTVGGMACGACWEHVIRTDERQHLHDESAAQGSCVLCGALPTTTQEEA